MDPKVCVHLTHPRHYPLCGLFGHGSPTAGATATVGHTLSSGKSLSLTPVVPSRDGLFSHPADDICWRFRHFFHNLPDSSHKKTAKRARPSQLHVGHDCDKGEHKHSHKHTNTHIHKHPQQPTKHNKNLTPFSLSLTGADYAVVWIILSSICSLLSNFYMPLMRMCL